MKTKMKWLILILRDLIKNKIRITARYKFIKFLLAVFRNFALVSLSQGFYILVGYLTTGLIFQYTLFVLLGTLALSILLTFFYDWLDGFMTNIDDRDMIRFDFRIGSEWKFDHFDEKIGKYRKIGIHILPFQFFITLFRR